NLGEVVLGRLGLRRTLRLAADVAAALRGQHVEVGRQAVGGHRLEHAVLQYVLAGVVPVVGDLVVVVVAHHVERVAARRAAGIGRRARLFARRRLAGERLGYEA